MSKKEFTWETFYKALAEKISKKYTENPEWIEKELRKLMTDGLKQEILFIDLDSKIKKYWNNNLTDRIDPFTFFSNFNRWINFDNRKKIIEFINWGLELWFKEPKEDYLVPTLNNQNSLFFSLNISETDKDIDNLWIFFQQWVAGEINENYFNQILDQKAIWVAKATMWLFWINPEKYISLDKNTLWAIEDLYYIRLPNSKFEYSIYVDIMEKLKLKLWNTSFVKLVQESYWKIGYTYITKETEGLSNWFIELISNYNKLPISILIKWEWWVWNTQEV